MKLSALKKHIRKATYFAGDGLTFAQDDEYDAFGDDQDFAHGPDELASMTVAKKRKKARKR